MALCWLALSASCAGPGWTPLNGPALRLSNPRAIGVEARSSAIFRTPTGPRIGGLIAMAQNSGIMKEAVEDPAEQVGDVLAELLAKRYRLEVSRQGRPDLTLSIRTSDWGIECRGGCYVVYRASLELRDNRNGHLLAAGDCENAATDPIIAESTGAGYHVDVTRVVGAMEQAAEDCVDFYRTKLFGIYGN